VECRDAHRALQLSGYRPLRRPAQPIPREECNDQQEDDDQDADADPDDFECAGDACAPGYNQELNATAGRTVPWV